MSSMGFLLRYIELDGTMKVIHCFVHVFVPYKSLLERKSKNDSLILVATKIYFDSNMAMLSKNI